MLAIRTKFKVLSAGWQIGVKNIPGWGQAILSTSIGFKLSKIKLEGGKVTHVYNQRQ